jgi:MATE family multidrug resistance protein
LQVVGLGALRGLQDVKVPSIVALLSYWVVALPLGYGLGFGLQLGSLGVWLGLLTGLTLVAGALLWRFRQFSRVPAPVVRPAAVAAG